jgi:hypothetical protein
MSISGQILYSSPEPVVLEERISIAAKLAGTQCPQALVMILMYSEMRVLLYPYEIQGRRRLLDEKGESAENVLKGTVM